MKKVLIALDYSTTAPKIAEAGYAMAKSMNAAATLLHVTTDAIYYASRSYSPVLGFDTFSDLDILETTPVEEIKKAAQDYLGQLKQHLGDETIQTVVEEGDSGDCILEVAAAINADIIVMGTHSRRGINKIMIGSVAEKVLRHSTIPLFIIPTKIFEAQ
ncbi:universal stress protein [Agriterribacter sp.]|uniref:universal stress protein n=1 Tax=Agriterribacter sp. TaxID=2821509 RepID=UPI002CC04DDA|nr:universal stress protein [Agriterribacter sp.]HTN06743.1 universal stress protein [Agriterribacter sp.]